MANRKLLGFYKVFIAKYSRIFLRSNGWFSLLSTVIITSIIIFVVGKDAFDSYSATRSAAFALVSACIWIGLFNSIQTICAERATIKQEMHSGVPHSSFLVGHLVFDFLLCLVEAFLVVLVLVLWYGDSLAADDALSSTLIMGLFAVFFLITFSADTLGLMISSVVKSPHQAMTIMPFVLILQLVMSGFLFKLQGIAEMLANATLAKWGLKGSLMAWNVNEMPIGSNSPSEATEQIQALNEQYVQQSLNENFEAYEPTLTNLLLVPAVFVCFIVLHTAVASVGIKLIEKDRR